MPQFYTKNCLFFCFISDRLIFSCWRNTNNIFLFGLRTLCPFRAPTFLQFYSLFKSFFPCLSFTDIYDKTWTALYLFLPAASSGMKTLTVRSPLSVPYLFFTRMLYLPESEVFTPVMVKLANLPDSNLRMQCSSDVISLSFFSQVTSGTGLPEMLQVRLRACGGEKGCDKCQEMEGKNMPNKKLVYLALLYGDHIRKTSCYSGTIWKKICIPINRCFRNCNFNGRKK